MHPPRARRSLRVSKEAGGFLGPGFNKFPGNTRKGVLFGALHERNMPNNFMEQNNLDLPARTNTPNRIPIPNLGANRFNRRGSCDSPAHLKLINSARKERLSIFSSNKSNVVGKFIRPS